MRSTEDSERLKAMHFYKLKRKGIQRLSPGHDSKIMALIKMSNTSLEATCGDTGLGFSSLFSWFVQVPKCYAFSWGDEKHLLIPDRVTQNKE